MKAPEAGRAHSGNLRARILSSSLGRNLISVAGATAAAKLLALLNFTIAARLLGPENFGRVGFATSLVAYASILLSPGLVVWGTREVARDHPRAGEILVALRAIQSGLAILAYGGLAAFAFFFTTDAVQRTVILCSGLSLFTTALTLDWLFNGLELMWVPAGIGILSAGATLAAVATLVRSPRDVGLYSIISPLGLAFGVACGYVVLPLKTQVRPTWPGWKTIAAAVRRSSWLGATSALVIVLHYANNILVKAFAGPVALGIFAAPFRIVEMATLLPGTLAVVFQPRLARFAAVRSGTARREAAIFARVHITAACLIGGFLFAESPAVIHLLYGAAYWAAAPLLRILSASIIFNYAICGYTNCLIAFGRDRVMLLVVAISAAVSVAGGFSLVPRFGATGAAVTVACIDCGGWIASLPYYQRTIGSLQLKAWTAPLLGGVTMYFASHMLQTWGMPLILRAPLVVAAYCPFAIRGMWAGGVNAASDLQQTE